MQGRLLRLRKDVMRIVSDTDSSLLPQEIDILKDVVHALGNVALSVAARTDR